MLAKEADVGVAGVSVRRVGSIAVCANAVPCANAWSTM